MKRLENEVINTITIEKSEFICYLSRATSEEEAKDYINKIRKLNKDATHNCYAFIIGNQNEIQRSNDDGEPSGTAGAPILEALRYSNINDIVAVVTRYFGGIKLGAGGLIRAYSKATTEALKQAVCLEVCEMNEYIMEADYCFSNKIDYLFLNNDHIMIEKDYLEQVKYHFLLPKENIEFLISIKELSSGKIIPRYCQSRFVERKIGPK